MKKYWLLPMLALLLTGCSAQETFETVSDIYAAPAAAQLHELQLSLPEDAALSSMEAEDGSKLYLCDGYTVTVQTLDAGDVDRTLREISGFGKDDLTVMQTRQAALDRYETTWCAAGEGEDQICHCVILDDGTYHYAVTVMADYTLAGQLSTAWQHILESVDLVNTG